jgi:chorismate mutase/prephenate dehydratase
LRLLNERAELVHEVGEIKRKDDLDIYVPGREDQLLRKLAEINAEQKGRLTERAIRAIFREIMSAALALEDSLKIAYLGPAGSWTHQVAVNKFGHCVEYLAEASTGGVFSRVAAQRPITACCPSSTPAKARCITRSIISRAASCASTRRFCGRPMPP